MAENRDHFFYAAPGISALFNTQSIRSFQLTPHKLWMMIIRDEGIALYPPVDLRRIRCRRRFIRFCFTEQDDCW